MARDLYMFKFEAEGLLGEIFLNGIPQRMLLTPNRLETTDQVNYWIKGGINYVDIKLQKLEKESFNLKVIKTDANGGLTETVTEYLLSSKDNESEIEYPFQTRLQFSVATPPPTELWSLLSTIDFTRDYKKEIYLLINQLRIAFDEKKMTVISKLLQFKALDVAQAFYFPKEDAIAAQLSFFEGFMENLAWGIKPYDDEDLEFHLIADNKIIWVTRKNFEPALVSMPNTDGASFQLPLYIAWIKGEWIIVR